MICMENKDHRIKNIIFYEAKSPLSTHIADATHKIDAIKFIIAEIELSSEDESFKKPGWLGKEVSHDARYYNSSLVIHPYNQW